MLESDTGRFPRWTCPPLSFRDWSIRHRSLASAFSPASPFAHLSSETRLGSHLFQEALSDGPRARALLGTTEQLGRVRSGILTTNQTVPGDSAGSREELTVQGQNAQACSPRQSLTTECHHPGPSPSTSGLQRRRRPSLQSCGRGSGRKETHFTAEYSRKGVKAKTIQHHPAHTHRGSRCCRCWEQTKALILGGAEKRQRGL